MFALGVAAIGASALSQACVRDYVLLNQSQSVPTGFYLRTDAPVTRGSFVTVRAADVAQGYAMSRRFTDAGDRFIKRVAAVRDEPVCAEGGVVMVGRLRVERQSHDGNGRELPSWNGCRVLAEGEVFLLGDTPDSFDSRYFGIVSADEIEGVWRPL